MARTIKDLIKSGLETADNNPYVKNFYIRNSDLGVGAGAGKVLPSNLLETVMRECATLKDEVGYKLQVEFLPDCCFFRAHLASSPSKSYIDFKERFHRARNNSILQ